MTLGSSDDVIDRKNRERTLRGSRCQVYDHENIVIRVFSKGSLPRLMFRAAASMLALEKK